MRSLDVTFDFASELRPGRFVHIGLLPDPHLVDFGLQLATLVGQFGQLLVHRFIPCEYFAVFTSRS
jgi:hypothetical protein